MRSRLLGVTALMMLGCDGNSVSSYLGAQGGELCLPDRRICIAVPLNALETERQLIIRSSQDRPGGALSETWDIGPDRLRFAKAATVTVRYDLLDGGLDSLSPSVVRIYTRDLDDAGNYGDWQSLDSSEVDRVSMVVRGKTSHLSPFVLLRTDRLSDGGLPIEGDAGVEKDAGVIICPPPCMPSGNCSDSKQNNSETDVDCGGENMCPRCTFGKICSVNSDCESNRCGTAKTCRNPVVDAGVDAGTDAGMDAGRDAGTDAGFDAGISDAGFDAGIDAGFDGGHDAGFDAGVDAGVDAGITDAGFDAGVDAGELDAGDGG